jgi:ABC-type dipeptide/oligopeptide/nickel transport system permease component
VQGLSGHIIRRLLFLPVILFVVSFGAFFITRWGPGDPVRIAAGSRGDTEAVQRVQEKYGLDEPIVVQYRIWVEDLLLHGDFGPTYVIFRDRDILTELIWPKMWVSIRVASYAFFLTFLIGIPIGIFAALKRGSFLDPLMIGTFLFFSSLPSLILVPILVQVLAVNLGWVPPGGFDGLFSLSMVIPTIALTLPAIAGVARLARTATLTAIDEDFVRTARAKGLREFTVVSRHIVRNSVVPIMTTVIGLSLVSLIEGALFIEILLGIPGIGSFTFEAVQSQEYNVILAIVLITTCAFVFANLAVDIALITSDPRIRAGEKELQ